MVSVTVDGKKVGFSKVKRLAQKAREAGGRVIAKAREARKPEAQLARIKAKQELLKAKASLRGQRIKLAGQRAKLRGLQLKATGINVPKFVAGTRDLGDFAFGGLPAQSRRKKAKGKSFDPFSQF